GGGRRGPRRPGGAERGYGGGGKPGGARGWVLPRRAPPRPSPLSTMRKSPMPARSRAAAMPSPPNPAPTTTTRYVDSWGTGPPRALRGPGQDAARGAGIGQEPGTGRILVESQHATLGAEGAPLATGKVRGGQPRRSAHPGGSGGRRGCGAGGRPGGVSGRGPTGARG